MSTHPHLAGRGFKIQEVRTEEHAFPANRPGAEAAPSPTSNTLPPTHPLSQRLAAANPQPVDMSKNVSGTIPPTEAQNKKPTTLVEKPERPLSETDPRYVSVGLPSLHHFYPKFDISVCGIRGYHQAKFSRASKERNLRFLVEGISATIGDGVSAFDLSPSDFYFLMYWHRINSFPKNPQIVSVDCDDKGHLERTFLAPEDPKYLAPETLRIEQYLDKTTVDTTYLENLDMERWAILEAKYGLGVETMRDLVEFSELIDERETQRLADKRTAAQDAEDSISDDELTWLAGRAAFLAKEFLGESRDFQARIELVKEMEADELQSLEEYIDAVTTYGVKEFANLKCKECGAHHRVPISIDALSFLPSVR